MAQREGAQPVYVFDRDGVRGIIVRESLERGDARVLIEFDHGRTVHALKALLQPRSDGGYDLPLSLRALSDEHSERVAEDAAPAGAVEPDVVAVVPVIAEEARISTREVETGVVRIRKTIETAQEELDVSLLRERVQVERQPVERYLDEPAVPWYEGETLVIPVMEEVLVVEKRLLLREEIRVTTVRETSAHREAVTLQREQVEVTRDESGASSEATAAQTAIAPAS